MARAMIGGRSSARVLAAAVGLIVLFSASHAFTAANTVPASYAGEEQFTIDANALAPPDCDPIKNLTAIVTDGVGSGANELVLGTAGADTINGKGGNDCILGGGGNDTINGGAGNKDVCIGGPGTDTFSNCETQTQ